MDDIVGASKWYRLYIYIPLHHTHSLTERERGMERLRSGGKKFIKPSLVGGRPTEEAPLSFIKIDPHPHQSRSRFQECLFHHVARPISAMEQHSALRVSDSGEKAFFVQTYTLVEDSLSICFFFFFRKVERSPFENTAWLRRIERTVTPIRWFNTIYLFRKKVDQVLSFEHASVFPVDGSRLNLPASSRFTNQCLQHCWRRNRLPYSDELISICKITSPSRVVGHVSCF